jgi:3'(2'), 5'-bisphosphate nucleotidase
MKQDLIAIIKEAGEKVLEFYGSKDFKTKEDKSPLTLADQASHKYLCQKLLEIKNIPIVSEENEIAFYIRKDWDEFWLIDPLDGTKEFISGFDDFCINIAIIQKHKPILGVIYAPKLNELYWAEQGKGFEYHGIPQKRSSETETIVAVSRFHNSEISKNFITINNLNHIYTVGAALKFGRMALGQIDLYPRFEGSKEWDTAAGQIILKEAKCNMFDLTTKKEPSYNKPDVRNNYFIASSPNININQLQYPEFL